MNVNMRFPVLISLVAGFAADVYGQLPPAVLQIDVENIVFYVNDNPEYSKLATNPGVVPSGFRTFGSYIVIADIVAVNDRPARGTWTARATQLNSSPTPSPGQAIADIGRVNIVDTNWQILQADGTRVGTIMINGLAFGPPPPGALPITTGDDWTVVGGTGAYLGARGQGGLVEVKTPGRIASATEDPSLRRQLGGGSRRYGIHLLPTARPEILFTSDGPAVYHGDFAQVTAARPARPGEVLIAAVANLGPTRPATDPGSRFPASPLREVNSPVEVTVNERPVEVINKIGWPATESTYRVDFRMPAEASGITQVQITAAWIPGGAVTVPVR